MTGPETPREEEQPMSDTGVAEERALVEPVAVGPGEPGANGHDEPAAGRRPSSRRRPWTAAIGVARARRLAVDAPTPRCWR